MAYLKQVGEADKIKFKQILIARDFNILYMQIENEGSIGSESVVVAIVKAAVAAAASSAMTIVGILAKVVFWTEKKSEHFK